MTSENRHRWMALVLLCMGSLMIVLDTTIVNVALPSIRGDLHFSQTSLAWVVNAYMLTFGGFLLLGGRLGDLFGHRRLFIAGIALFTVSSLACGLATSKGLLVAARSVQGLGGAVASAVSLSLMVTLFTEPTERAKAMGAPSEMDVSKIEPGQMAILTWRRQPIYIVRRTPEMVEHLKGHDDLLKDKDSESSEQPPYAKNAYRARLADGLIQQILEHRARALEAVGADVREVVRDHVHLRLLRIHAGRGDVE